MRKLWMTVYAVIDLKDATITIIDGSTPANELEVKIGEGNLTYSEKRNMQYILDRGALDEVREGDEVPVDVSMNFTWEYLRGSVGTPTIEEALKNIGEAAAWESSDADACRPYAVDIKILYKPTPVACGDQEVIILSDFRWEDLNHDLRGGAVAVTGKCNVTQATVTRQANST